MCLTGTWFNIKTSSYQNRKSNCGDKTFVRHLISAMGFSILVKCLYTESAPESHEHTWKLFHGNWRYQLINKIRKFAVSTVNESCGCLELCAFTHSVNYLKYISTHDDVIKWKHFPHYWPFVRGIHRSSVISPHKGQWCGALMLSLICAWINGWVNNREAGDLRRHCGHYDISVAIQTARAVGRLFRCICLPDWI